MKTQICVNAATGRMGQQLIYSINESSSAALSSALCRSAHPFHKKTVRQSDNIKYSNDTRSGLLISQVLIDFSLPTVSLAVLDEAVATKTPILIGTTGFSQDQLTRIKEASKKVPILVAPNTSIGVNAALSLIAEATRLLGNQADIEIIESHHKHKVDAPSGTAIKIGEVISEQLGSKFSENAIYDRTQQPKQRESSDIGISVVRAGSIVGEHKVMFALDNEIITIEHKAQSRQCFADGAVKAACWLVKQQNGFYSMKDFLSD